MSASRTRVTGPVMLPDGSDAQDHGRIVFTLRSWDREGAALVLQGPVVAPIEDGSIDVDLWRTVEGERGTVYQVSYVYWSQVEGRQMGEALGVISLTGPGPVSLVDLLALPAPVPDVPDLLAQAIAAAGSASGDRVAATAAREAAEQAAVVAQSRSDIVLTTAFGGAGATLDTLTYAMPGITSGATVRSGDTNMLYTVLPPDAPAYHIQGALGLRVNASPIYGPARPAYQAAAFRQGSRDRYQAMLDVIPADSMVINTPGALFEVDGQVLLSKPVTITGEGEMRWTAGPDLVDPIRVCAPRVRIRNAYMTNPLHLQRLLVSGGIARTHAVAVEDDDFEMTGCVLDGFANPVAQRATHWADSSREPRGFRVSGNRLINCLGAGGTLTAINVTAGGSGYTSAPSVSFEGTWVGEITVTDGGSGYTTPPTVILSGGDPADNASAEAILGRGGDADKVVSIIVTIPGTGYASAPAVSFSGGGGDGAAAEASLGVAHTPALAVANVSGGAVTSITISFHGLGYKSTPRVVISGGGGSGASAAAALHLGEDRGDGIVAWGSDGDVFDNLVSLAPGHDGRIGIHAERLPRPGAIWPHSDARWRCMRNTVIGAWRRGIAQEGMAQYMIRDNVVIGATWWGIAAVRRGQQGSISGNMVLWTSSGRPSPWYVLRAPYMIFGDINGLDFRDNHAWITEGGSASGMIVVETDADLGAPLRPAGIKIRGGTYYASDLSYVNSAVYTFGSVRITSGLDVGDMVAVGPFRRGIYGTIVDGLRTRRNDIRSTLPGAVDDGIMCAADTSGRLRHHDNVVTGFVDGFSIINCSGGEVSGCRALNGRSFLDLSGSTGICTERNGWAGLSEMPFRNVGTLQRSYIRDNQGQFLNQVATLTPGVIAAGAVASQTVTVAGATVGDEVAASYAGSLAGLIQSQWVSATDAVTIQWYNPTGSAITRPPSGTVVEVRKVGTAVAA